MRVRTSVALLVAAVVIVGACSDDADDTDKEATTKTCSEDCPDHPAEEPVLEGDLVGLATVTAGVCGEGGVTAGSYFQMVVPGGTLEDGPFFDNEDSPCGDTAFLPFEPGTDGGLVVGDYQPAPQPAFDDAGNGLADAITQPASLLGLDIATATAETDPQTGESVPPPSLTVLDGELSGDFSAFSLFAGSEAFNQGAPKPDGSNPGLTSGPAGIMDPQTGDYTLEWVSQFVGGSLDGVTGVWHFEGTFDAEAAR